MTSHIIRRLAGPVLAGAMVAVLGGAVLAAPITLRNAASWARIWPYAGEEAEGMDIWVVNQPDGTDLNILNRQWFWYRVDRKPDLVDDMPPLPFERPLASLDPDPLVVPSDTDGDGLEDNLFLRYVGLDEGLQVEVNYRLMGGVPGSARADMAETIRLVNTASVAQTVHFFQYADFNLSFMEDTAWIRLPQVADQWFVGSVSMRMSETVVTPVPTAGAAAVEPILLDLLNDPFPTTLAGLPQYAEGDVAWAFQWSMRLEPQACLLISKDKSLTPTPEPATLALVGLGAAALAARRRRGRS